MKERMIAYTKDPNYKGDIAALIYGMILPLAFAPFDLFVIAFISPALLLILCLNASPRRAFLRGSLYGAGLFGVGTSWIYISLHVYGQANMLVAGGITALLILIMLFFFGLMCYVLSKFFPKNLLTKCIIVFPSLWVFQEWARGWFLTGFPWLFVGYTQLDTPLSNFAPIASVYVVSWLTICISGLLVVIFVDRKNPRLILPCVSILFTIGMVAWNLSDRSWTSPAGDPVKVSLIQGNVPQTLKWNSNEAEAILLSYKGLTDQYRDSQIIVWPEAAITYLRNDIPPFLENLNQELKAENRTLITGIPVYENGHYYNGIIALGNGSGEYFKRHLVPFGEYMPLRSWLVWLDGHLQIPMSDFTPGENKQPLIVANGIPIASSICYEIVYPTETLRDVPEGQLLVTVSDDSWFGKSLAPAQHLQMARMRALETGRYLLMATNDGLTAIVNNKGKIQAIAPPFEEAVLTGMAYPFKGRTPWMYASIYPLFLLLMIFLFWGWHAQRKFKIDL